MELDRTRAFLWLCVLPVVGLWKWTSLKFLNFSFIPLKIWKWIITLSWVWWEDWKYYTCVKAQWKSSEKTPMELEGLALYFDDIWWLGYWAQIQKSDTEAILSLGARWRSYTTREVLQMLQNEVSVLQKGMLRLYVKSCNRFISVRLLGHGSSLQRRVSLIHMHAQVRLQWRRNPLPVNAVTLSFLAWSLCLLNSFLPGKEKTKGKEGKEDREGIIWTQGSPLTCRETKGRNTLSKSLALSQPGLLGYGRRALPQGFQFLGGWLFIVNSPAFPWKINVALTSSLLLVCFLCCSWALRYQSAGMKWFKKRFCHLPRELVSSLSLSLLTAKWG